MAYFTKSQLIEISRERVFSESEFIKSAHLKRVTIFLSHSHNDNDIALGLKNAFNKYGIDLYIDWLDMSMPQKTNQVTALKIKEKIKQASYFLVLATDNAMQSRWVPWEIGVADTLKENKKIGILPIINNPSDEFKGNEYLQLYNKIELFNNKIKIFQTNSFEGNLFDDWIKTNII